MKVIITTVGTSLLTNLLQTEFYEEYYKEDGGEELSTDLVKKIKFNKVLNETDRKSLFKVIKELLSAKQSIEDGEIFYEKSSENTLNLNASAEIKSICKIANGEPAIVYLLTTDTDISEFAAEKIKEALDGKNDLEFKEIKRIDGLKIDDPENFEKIGFSQLIEEIDKVYNKHKKDDIILNISGGYKALTPFLTIYGQLQNIPLNYIYEDSNELVKISSSLLGFNEAEAEFFEPFLNHLFLQKNEYTNEEQRVIDVLKEKNFINANKEIIGLGHLLKEFSKNKIILNKGALGDIVEIKLWEYYMNNNEINGKRYRVEHGKKIGENKFDIDLFFTETNKEKNKIFCEIKSFGRVLNEINTIISDYQKRKKVAEEKNWNLEQYWLLIYKAKFHDINLLDTNRLINEGIKIKYIDIDTFKDFKTGYNSHAFIHKPIENIEINEFTRTT